MNWNVFIAWLIITFTACHSRDMNLKAPQELLHLWGTKWRNIETLSRYIYFFIKKSRFVLNFDFEFLGILNVPLNQDVTFWNWFWLACLGKPLCSPESPLDFFYLTTLFLTGHNISIFALSMENLSKSQIILLIGNYKMHTVQCSLKSTFWFWSF